MITPIREPTATNIPESIPKSRISLGEHARTFSQARGASRWRIAPEIALTCPACAALGAPARAPPRTLSNSRGRARLGALLICLLGRLAACRLARLAFYLLLFCGSMQAHSAAPCALSRSGFRRGGGGTCDYIMLVMVKLGQNTCTCAALRTNPRECPLVPPFSHASAPCPPPQDGRSHRLRDANGDKLEPARLNLCAARALNRRPESAHTQRTPIQPGDARDPSLRLEVCLSPATDAPSALLFCVFSGVESFAFFMNVTTLGAMRQFFIA